MHHFLHCAFIQYIGLRCQRYPQLSRSFVLFLLLLLFPPFISQTQIIYLPLTYCLNLSARLISARRKKRSLNIILITFFFSCLRLAPALPIHVVLSFAHLASYRSPLRTLLGDRMVQRAGREREREISRRLPRTGDVRSAESDRRQIALWSGH